MKRKFLVIFIATSILALTACGTEKSSQIDDTHTESMMDEDAINHDEEIEDNDNLLEKPLSEEQLIYSNNGITIYASYLDFEYYKELGVALGMYAENNSGIEIDIQTINGAVNTYTMDVNGVNNSGKLLDGQKGWFYQKINFDDLERYNISPDKGIESIQFEMNIWDIDAFEIIDSCNVNLIVNPDNTITSKEIAKSEENDSLDSENSDSDVSITEQTFIEVVNLDKSKCSKDSLGMYSFDGITFTSDDCEWIDDKLNKDGTVETGACYRKLAMCLEGFAMGNNWDSYAEQILGYMPESKEQFSQLVDDLSSYIVRNESDKAMIGKLESISCVDVKKSDSSYEIKISDVSECALELGISEKMLAYMMGVFKEYVATITFDKQVCNIIR